MVAAQSETGAKKWTYPDVYAASLRHHVHRERLHIVLLPQGPLAVHPSPIDIILLVLARLARVGCKLGRLSQGRFPTTLAHRTARPSGAAPGGYGGHQ